MKKLFQCSTLLIFSILQCQAVSLNYLTKVYQHQGNVSDNLVCYFTQEPICNKLPQKVTNESGKNNQENNQETLHYFLPMTALQGSEVKNMLNKVHATQNTTYMVMFEEVTKPIKGIKVTITYDPRMIMVDYKEFDAITGNKGLVFSFHNKEFLSKIKLSTDPLLQYALNIRDHKDRPKVMLDFGHGGMDEGKVGFFHVQEKVINFQVGTKVAALLQKAGCDVCSTRDGDYYVALDERTTHANKKKVDLFLSIHANSGATNIASGIETYWLDSNLLKPKCCLVNTKNLAGDALQRLALMKSTLSALLAQSVHDAALAAAKKVYAVNDRKVKTSVAQVLLGTEMLIPSALIEIGFLSHQQETKLLMDNTYQHKIAQGIAQGIMNYFKKCSVL